MQNNYMNLLNSVPLALKKHLRSIENISDKIIKREWSKTFNHVCLQENRLYGQLIRNSYICIK